MENSETDFVSVKILYFMYFMLEIIKELLERLCLKVSCGSFVVMVAMQDGLTVIKLKS